MIFSFLTLLKGSKPFSSLVMYLASKVNKVRKSFSHFQRTRELDSIEVVPVETGEEKSKFNAKSFAKPGLEYV